MNDREIKLTKKEADLILFALATFQTVGEYELRGRVTTREYDTAEKIVDKLKDLFPDF